MFVMGVLTYDVRDYEALNKPGQIILANHPSLLDVVFLIAFIQRADCVVKSSLLSNPFTMGAMRMAGYIANENPEQVVLQTAESLKRGNSLIIFPEGTRTTPGVPLKMKRGAANIALQSKGLITPVIIRCQPTTLTKQHKWYNIPHKRFHVELIPQPNLPIDEFHQEPLKSFSSRKLTRFLENYFIKELAKYE
jgi:1-acyl-sn-glycerol-3-phosphate acyltransferase